MSRPVLARPRSDQHKKAQADAQARVILRQLGLPLNHGGRADTGRPARP